jgi:hypothetical protein
LVIDLPPFGCIVYMSSLLGFDARLSWAGEERRNLASFGTAR